METHRAFLTLDDFLFQVWSAGAEEWHQVRASEPMAVLTTDINFSVRWSTASALFSYWGVPVYELEFEATGGGLMPRPEIDADGTRWVRSWKLLLTDAMIELAGCDSADTCTTIRAANVEVRCSERETDWLEGDTTDAEDAVWPGPFDRPTCGCCPPPLQPGGDLGPRPG